MSIRNGVALVVALLALAVTLPGQESETRVKLEDLPAAVRKTVMEQSKGATLRGLTKEIEHGKTYYEAELIVNGHSKDVLIAPSGAIVEIEEEVTFHSLPAVVRAGLEKQAGAGKILKVESITKNNAIVAYEAQVRAGGKKSEIKVTADGKPITHE